jgi:magnesium transporter
MANKKVTVKSYKQEINHQGLTWVNLSRQTGSELLAIKKNFNLQEQDIEECRPSFQRAKIVKRDDYYFMVLHFPVYNRQTGRLGFAEVDFFLSRNFLITVHDQKLFVLDEFFKTCEKHIEERQKYFQGTAAHILLELVDRLLESIFPILLHVSEDINLVDRKLFASVSGREMAEEILRLKTNIVSFRRTMQGHRTVLERLIIHSGRELELYAYQTYINSLRQYTNEIWHTLESQKESINAMHEANESILTLRTNNVMKTLTIISVITFPLTLLATIFNMTVPGNPFLVMPYGFLVIVGIMIFGVLFMVRIFKKKDWM